MEVGPKEIIELKAEVCHYYITVNGPRSFQII